MGKLLPGVKKSFEKIKEKGYEIYIHSCRTSSDLYPHLIDRSVQVDLMREVLDKNEIPYDHIITDMDKPIASYYIDDRGIGFRGSWEDTLKEIE